jgi:hypothetical protein
LYQRNPYSLSIRRQLDESLRDRRDYWRHNRLESTGSKNSRSGGEIRIQISHLQKNIPNPQHRHRLPVDKASSVPPEALKCSTTLCYGRLDEGIDFGSRSSQVPFSVMTVSPVETPSIETSSKKIITTGLRIPIGRKDRMGYSAASSPASRRRAMFAMGYGWMRHGHLACDRNKQSAW